MELEIKITKAAEDYCEKQECKSLEQELELMDAFIAGVNYIRNKQYENS